MDGPLFVTLPKKDNMLFSMTGYGKAEANISDQIIRIEIKSLNSKNLDLNIRVPSLFRSLELTIRNEISKALIRGKIDCSIQVTNNESAVRATLNTHVIEDYICQMQSIAPADKFQYLSLAVRMPEAFSPHDKDLSEQDQQTLYKLLWQALEQLNQFRDQEGASMQKDFHLRVSEITEILDKIESVKDERLSKIQSRLHEEFKKMQLEVDASRFEQELIYYLEKLDITEEIVRLKNHLSYFITTLEENRTAKGKKLGFIAQEIGREINTIGSKSSDYSMQQDVVQMKDALEKIKEQLLNVL